MSAAFRTFKHLRRPITRPIDSCGVGVAVSLSSPSNGVVKDAKHLLCGMQHRAGIDVHGHGDGAGVLLSTPHSFYQEVVGPSLPNQGEYIVCIGFLDAAYEFDKVKESVERLLETNECDLIEWQHMPLNRTGLDDVPQLIHFMVKKRRFMYMVKSPDDTALASSKCCPKRIPTKWGRYE